MKTEQKKKKIDMFIPMRSGEAEHEK